MYKLFVTTFYSEGGYESKTSCVHTITIDFTTIEDANVAYENLKNRDGIMGTKREVVKLYKT